MARLERGGRKVIPYGSILIIAALAILFYWIGEVDYRRGFLVAAASVALALFTLFVLQWGLLGNLCSQAALFAALLVINVFRKRR